MANKSFISDATNAGRIVSHGQITDLSKGFDLGGIPFSIYVRPKSASDEVDVVVSLKCWQDDDFSNAPVALNDWSPLAIAEIKANAISLSDYDVFWGAGDYVENK